MRRRRKRESDTYEERLCKIIIIIILIEQYVILMFVKSLNSLSTGHHSCSIYQTCLPHSAYNDNTCMLSICDFSYSTENWKKTEEFKARIGFSWIFLLRKCLSYRFGREVCLRILVGVVFVKVMVLRCSITILFPAALVFIVGHRRCCPDLDF